MEKKLVPELRFPGFSGEWEEKSLGELLEFKNGINASKEQYGKGIKFINVLDILQNNFITYENIIGKVDVDDKTAKNSEVNYGDILFQRSSETREEVGKANVYLDKKPATFGGFVIRGKKISKYDPIFLNLILDRPYTRHEIMKRAGGSTRYNVSQKILSESPTLLPTMKEQEKIGSFFTLIDEKIEKQEERLINLEEYKKGMMQKIFSQEIRFKDDNGEDYPEWERKRLGETSQIKTGTSNVQDSIENGKYNFFDRSVIVKRLNKYDYDEEAIIYPGEGSNFYPKYYKGKYGLHQRAYSITSNEINMKYLSNILMLRNNHFLKTAVGSTVKSLRMNSFLECPVSIPVKEEQVKIANFLSSIDFKIEKETEKLESLKYLKKGLMERMFV